MPRRIDKHITETKSLKIFMNLIPDEWVIRDLSERDYGIDLMVEIFSETGEPTGWTFYAQLKGTVTNDIASIQLDKAFIEYVEKYPIPFFLFYIDVNNKRARFIHLQKYIARKMKKDKHKSKKIHLPKENLLCMSQKNEAGLAKISKISRSLHYKVEGIKFASKFISMSSQIDAINAGNHTNDAKIRNFLTKELNSLKELKNLLLDNSACVSETDLEEIIENVKENNFANINNENTSYLNLNLLANTFINHDELDEFEEEVCGTIDY